MDILYKIIWPTTIVDNLLIKQCPFFCNYFVGATLSNKTTFYGSVKKLLEASQPSSEHYLHPLVAISGCDLSETLSSGRSLNIHALSWKLMWKRWIRKRTRSWKELCFSFTGVEFYCRFLLIWTKTLFFNMHLVFSAQAFISLSPQSLFLWTLLGVYL